MPDEVSARDACLDLMPMSEQISEDYWTYHDIEELKETLSDWLDDTVERLGGEREVSSRVDDEGKLNFRIHDVILSDPKDKGDEQDLYVTIEKVESTGGWIVKGLQKYELTVLNEKNKSTNERKLKKEIEKLLSQSAQLREVRLVQIKTIR